MGKINLYNTIPLGEMTTSDLFLVTQPNGGNPRNGNVSLENLLQVISQYNAYPRGYKNGFILSNNGNFGINISAGSARSSNNDFNLNNNSLITKYINQSFQIGNSNGGLPSSLSLTNGTWYHVFVISNGSLVDCYFDTSISASNIPSGFSYFRRVGSVYYIDGTSGIDSFYQLNKKITWNTSKINVNGGTPSTTAILQTISTPLGVNTIARLNFVWPDPGSGSFGNAALLTSPYQTDVAATNQNASVWTQHQAGFSSTQSAELNIPTDLNSKIRIRFNNTTPVYYLYTIGWEDLDL